MVVMLTITTLVRNKATATILCQASLDSGLEVLGFAGSRLVRIQNSVILTTAVDAMDAIFANEEMIIAWPAYGQTKDQNKPANSPTIGHPKYRQPKTSHRYL